MDPDKISYRLPADIKRILRYFLKDNINIKFW